MPKTPAKTKRPVTAADVQVAQEAAWREYLAPSENVAGMLELAVHALDGQLSHDQHVELRAQIAEWLHSRGQAAREYASLHYAPTKRR